MFKIFYLLTLFFTVYASDMSIKYTTLDSNNEWELFSNFQERFSKRYNNIQELETRFQIFRTNIRNIISHNLDNTYNFTMGINQFTDLTPSEFKQQYASSYKGQVQSFGCVPFSSSTTNLPASLDWTTQGVVSSVRDQGKCGSCWAFATTANAESVWAISTGKLIDMSEELLVDCATGVGYLNMGCNGGNPDSAFKYMIQNGQCTEASYPCTSGTTGSAGPCEKCTSADARFTNCYDVPPKNQVALKAAVSKRPVVVAIEADTVYFQFYSGGVLTDGIKCGTTLDHAVEIVGFGTLNGIDYWKVRNSWGPSWGLAGYVLIQKSSSTNDIGVCGIAAQPSFISV
jgi:C1A family cysteine protease